MTCDMTRRALVFDSPWWGIPDLPEPPPPEAITSRMRDGAVPYGYARPGTAPDGYRAVAGRDNSKMLAASSASFKPRPIRASIQMAPHDVLKNIHAALIGGGTLLPGPKSFRGGGGGNSGSGMFSVQAPGGGGGSRQSLPQPRSSPNLVALASIPRRHSEGGVGGGGGTDGGGSGGGSRRDSGGGASSNGLDGDVDGNDALVAMAAARVTSSATMLLMEDHLAPGVRSSVGRCLLKLVQNPC